MSTNADAPYGYTPTGRVRKKPVKNSKAALPAPAPTPLTTPQVPTPTAKLIKCPACDKHFQHQMNPQKAVWQHLFHYTKGYFAREDHKVAYAALKEERKKGKGAKKERERANSARYRANNVRNAKWSSEMGTSKLQFERILRRAGELFGTGIDRFS
ncbi:hypothetical protein P167DRAFT_580380 [Morchella conica CCBAS932]|uniref:Uncharacterized protein n=1 Tax=Morchella conica CCBAS932 TaxID=1392247 RepID=A0A3N4K7P2_9PEZI|nr:hypothetical protein P167DRAFT_580380 [Morchella conica CCBAS932]